jgi:integrase
MVWNARALGQDIPSQQQILEMARNIRNPGHRTLFVLSYLTAGRVNEVLDLEWSQFKMEERLGRKVMTIYHMLNEKHKTRKSKTFHIPIDREKELVRLILPYLNTRKGGRIFRFRTRQRAWQILNKLGLFPHYLRHVRLTHLVTIYGFSDQLLVKFAGWTNSLPAQYYMELRAEDILEKM